LELLNYPLTNTELWQYFGKKLPKKVKMNCLQKISTWFFSFLLLLVLLNNIAHYKPTITRKSDFLPLKKASSKSVIYVNLT
jgi:hypothetical protein